MSSVAGSESSVCVTVRVRPFTAAEASHLRKPRQQAIFLGDGALAPRSSDSTARELANNEIIGPTTPHGKAATIRNVVKVVDDKMLIFDPPEGNPMVDQQRAAFPTTKAGRIREHRFVFDRLFDTTVSQEEVYQHTTRPLLDNVLEGFNATVFAYGATGCGKTHTISGTPEQPGIIFLTMRELFQKIEDLKDTKIIQVSLSFLEIYNETIKDLLDPCGRANKRLTLREDAEKRISVTNLSSHSPTTVEQVMDLVLTGNNNRTISPTEANATSSRSHAVLQVNVMQKSRTASLTEAHTYASLSIIDLAGSERASVTKNRGDRLFEGANINRSLLALGNCINALCDPKQRNHIPYRDSKLTRLLKFSLGGNCKTIMIVCISPSSQHYDETLNTLKYADRAKMIKTRVVRNQHNLDRHVGSYLKMITEQREEIKMLRERETRIAQETLALIQRKHAESQEMARTAVAKLLVEAKTILRPALVAKYQSIRNSSSQNSDSEDLEQIVSCETSFNRLYIQPLLNRMETSDGWTAADSLALKSSIRAGLLELELEFCKQALNSTCEKQVVSTRTKRVAGSNFAANDSGAPIKRHVSGPPSPCKSKQRKKVRWQDDIGEGEDHDDETTESESSKAPRAVSLPSILHRSSVTCLKTGSPPSITRDTYSDKSLSHSSSCDAGAGFPDISPAHKPSTASSSRFGVNSDLAPKQAISIARKAPAREPTKWAPRPSLVSAVLEKENNNPQSVKLFNSVINRHHLNSVSIPTSASSTPSDQHSNSF